MKKLILTVLALGTLGSSQAMFKQYYKTSLTMTGLFSLWFGKQIGYWQGSLDQIGYISDKNQFAYQNFDFEGFMEGDALHREMSERLAAQRPVLQATHSLAKNSLPSVVATANDNFRERLFNVLN